jgi:hypothetical protein
MTKGFCIAGLNTSIGNKVCPANPHVFSQNYRARRSELRADFKNNGKNTSRPAWISYTYFKLFIHANRLARYILWCVRLYGVEEPPWPLVPEPGADAHGVAGASREAGHRGSVGSVWRPNQDRTDVRSRGEFVICNP